MISRVDGKTDLSERAVFDDRARRRDKCTQENRTNLESETFSTASLALMTNSRRRFVAAVALWLVGTRAQATDARALEAGSLKSGVVVRGPAYEGVIFGASDAKLIRSFVDGDVKDYWSPTEQDVELFENHLRQALESGVKSPGTLSPTSPDRVYQRALPGHLRMILERLSDYRRQYFGIIGTNNSKRLFMNLFFPSRFHENWTGQYVFVFDGGTAYWRIQFDFASKRFMQFNTNGFA